MNPSRSRRFRTARRNSGWPRKPSGTGWSASSRRCGSSPSSIAPRSRPIAPPTGVDRGDRSDPDLGRYDQVATGLPDLVAPRRDRQPPSRDHDADRVRVRLHAGEQKPDIDAVTERADLVRRAGRPRERRRRPRAVVRFGVASSRQTRRPAYRLCPRHAPHTIVISRLSWGAKMVLGISAWTPRTMSTTWVTRKLTAMLHSA